MLEATQAWAERLQLGEMQREDPYSRPFMDLLCRDMSAEAKARRMRAMEADHPECFAYGKRKQSVTVPYCSKRAWTDSWVVSKERLPM